MVALVDALQFERKSKRGTGRPVLADAPKEGVVMISVGTGQPGPLPYNYERLVDGGWFDWMLPIFEVVQLSQSQLVHHQTKFLLGDPGVQHHELHGSAHPECAALVCPVRARGHPRQDAPLIKAVSRGWNLRRSLERGAVDSVAKLARVAECSVRHVTRLLKLAYLAPDITEAILAGRQPQELTLAQLYRTDIPLDWQAQRQALGF